MRESRHKKLTRSGTDRIIAGVFGGLATYFRIPANLLRILYVIITIFTGFVPGVIIYIILMVIMPADPQRPDLLSLLKSFGESQKGAPRPQNNSRRTLTDVEEKDIKRNRRS